MVACPLALPISNTGGQAKDGVASAVWGYDNDVTWCGCELEAGTGVMDHGRGAHPSVCGQWPKARIPSGEIPSLRCRALLGTKAEGEGKGMTSGA